MSRLVVVKLGGNAALASVPQVARMAREARICVVHGGGAQISALARLRGIDYRLVGIPDTELTPTHDRDII